MHTSSCRDHTDVLSTGRVTAIEGKEPHRPRHDITSELRGSQDTSWDATLYT